MKVTGRRGEDWLVKGERGEAERVREVSPRWRTVSQPSLPDKTSVSPLLTADTSQPRLNELRLALPGAR